jgi:hypothetical protein
MKTPPATKTPIISMTPVGSRETCVPPPTDTDQDWLVLIEPEQWNPLCEELQVEWVFGGSLIRPEEHRSKPEERFWSWVRGEDNLIVTDSPLFHQRFLAASSVAKRLNLLMKGDRVALFQAVLYSTIDSNDLEGF